LLRFFILNSAVCSEPLERAEDEEEEKKSSIKKSKSSKASASSKKGKAVAAKPTAVSTMDESIAQLLAAGEQVSCSAFYCKNHSYF